jgi:NADH:ubiquinone oxidoreductase subunit F (NADH-binding)
MSASLAGALVPLGPTTLPRLLSAATVDRPWDHAAHVARVGPLLVVPATRPDERLIAEVEQSGLTGRGGAAFPVAMKLRAVANRAGGIVVVNATEGEPASAKDSVLVGHAPHLVLDGAVVAAAATGAGRIVICVDRHRAALVATLQRAIAERPAGEPPVSVATTPSRYLAGEATALVHWLDGGEAKPTYGALPHERGIARQPALVQNAETVAHLALIARHGAAWFRGLGTGRDPGTALLTVTGAVDRPGVTEVALGTPLAEVLQAACARDGARAALVGGYGGTWLRLDGGPITLDREALQPFGATVGAGVIAVVDGRSCGIAELAGLAGWMAGEGAGQCGPCAFGLPAVAAVLSDVVARRAGANDLLKLERWLGELPGRGACRHPDGVARMVGSGLRVFASDLTHHLRGGPCPSAGRAPLLPIPDRSGEPWR